MLGTVFAVFYHVSSAGFLLVAIVSECLPNLPKQLRDISSYGKVAEEKDKERKPTAQLFQVPKRWFTHFYILGVISSVYGLVTAVRFYVYRIPLPAWIQTTIHYMDIDHNTSTDSLSAIVLISLMVVHTVRRLYECLFVSVYSKGTMHVLHHLLGIVLYGTFFICILIEAPRGAEYLKQKDNILSHLSWRHLVGVPLHLWASYHHHIVHRQFAAFRQNNKGSVVTLQHVIPHGGYFELVSTPHFFFEMLLYVAYMLVGGYHHLTLVAIAVFVWVNQLITGLLTHKWYKQNFKNYPASRRAIIPYIL